MKKNRKQEKVQRASTNTVQKKTGFKILLNNWVFVEAAVKDMQYVRTGTQV